MKKISIRCDIFCAVVDNYGDIGVCWRLASQLAHEFEIIVRLWVDDLESFSKLCPQINTAKALQVCNGIEVRHWVPQFVQVTPADLVIESFACKLPQGYLEAMAAQPHPPVWINLEHLSAEEWVAGCHGLPSPHPSLPLTKYFFFPGFTPDTGGLLLERGLFERCNQFQKDPVAIETFWQAFGVLPPGRSEMRVSLFCYENPALPALLSAWAAGSMPVSCFVPEGPVLPQLAKFFGQAQALPGEIFRRGNLQVHVLPIMDQQRYDQLLWACDLNFVRGEDSFVRAQWAARPFVWHIYPQHDQAHIAKLHAFIESYGSGLAPNAATAWRVLCEGWNSTEDMTARRMEQAWNDFLSRRSMLRQHTLAWAQRLSGNSLTLNLLNFYQKIDRMRATSDSK